MTGEQRTVNAATFRSWYELLEEIVAHDTEEIAPGNRRSAVILLHDLVAVGLRQGAIRPVVIHSSGPSSYAHLMFRYTLDPAFDWTGEIDVGPEAPITEIERATDFPEHPPLA